MWCRWCTGVNSRLAPLAALEALGRRDEVIVLQLGKCTGAPEPSLVFACSLAYTHVVDLALERVAVGLLTD